MGRPTNEEIEARKGTYEDNVNVIAVDAAKRTDRQVLLEDYESRVKWGIAWNLFYFTFIDNLCALTGLRYSSKNPRP